MPLNQPDLKPGLSSRSGILKALHDTRGNVMPIAAIGMIAMAGMVGGGVDISRAYMVQNRLQNACDAGVLAGRRAVVQQGYDNAAQTQAENYFYTNFDQDVEGTQATTFVTTASENDNRIDGLATTNLDTVVMSLFGFDDLDLSVDCTASMSVGNSDVMMVLDTTGSMGWTLSGTQTRLQALQDAMKGFYDTVETASAGGNARIRYGFVPYSSSVNVGAVLNSVNPDYLADTTQMQSREPDFEDVEVRTQDGWEDPVVTVTEFPSAEVFSDYEPFGQRYRRPRLCRNALPANTDWASGNGANGVQTSTSINSQGQKVVTEVRQTGTETRTEYRCAAARVVINGRRTIGWFVHSRTVERGTSIRTVSISDPIFTTVTTREFQGFRYKSINQDTSSYKRFNNVTLPNGSNGSDQTFRWQGCIQERATVAQSNFSFNSVLGITPSGALDLDIDGAPDPSDPDTQWKPMWEGMTYIRTDASGRYYNFADEGDRGFVANTACPQAARLMAPMDESDFDAYADSLIATGATYHNLGMVWGARLASPSGIFQDTVTANPANGGAVARHIIFMTDGSLAPNSGVLSSYGIEYYDKRVTDNGFSDHSARHNARFLAACEATKAKGIRVWVIAFASSLTASLETCSSNESSFTASNAAQLNAAFQEIAKDVGELRVTQ